MAIAEKGEAQRTGPPLVVQLVLFAALTFMAAGLGWLTGSNLIPLAAEKSKPGTITSDREETTSRADEPAEGEPVEPNLYTLEPITTNLADPRDIWVRLEVSLAFEGPADAGLAQEIHQDILAYLRTVKLEQIDTASGFHHLKSDLEERAAIRSNGRVTDIFIRTLLFE